MIINITPLFDGKQVIDEQQCDLFVENWSLIGSVFFDADVIGDADRVDVNGLRLRWTPKGFTMSQLIDIEVMHVTILKGVTSTFQFRQPFTSEVMQSMFGGAS